MNRSLTSIVTSRVEYAQARSGFKSRCEGKRTQKRPFCLNKVQAAGSTELDSGFVLIDKKEKMGFSAIWCNHCHKGKIISRCKQPENIKTIKDIPLDIDYF